MSAGRGLDRLVRLFVAPAPEQAPRTRSAPPDRRPEERRLRLPARFVPPGLAGGSSAGEHAGGCPTEESATPPRAACVTVVCRPADAAALGPVVALALLRASRARAGLICAWPAAALSARRVGAPMRPAARQLRGALAARGIEARAAGSLAFVSLASDPDEAAGAARRAAAAAPGPVVHVLGGPRPDALAPLLHDADRVLVAGRPADLVCELALAGLVADGLDARPLPAPEAGTARALAAAGLAVPGIVRGALAEALEGLA